MMSVVEIKLEQEKNRAAAYDGDVNMGECTYTVSDGIWTIEHTFVDSAYKGQGIAKKLVDAVVEGARERGLKIIPVCSYAVRVFEDSAYADVDAR
jgi:predicted GNAT family acetyltransferase